MSFLLILKSHNTKRIPFHVKNKNKNYVCNRNIDVFKRTIEWMEELEAFNEHEDLFHLSPSKFQQQNPWRDDF
jgi:hypothetical protein